MPASSGGAAHQWPIDEAVREPGAGAYATYGSDSRVRATKARKTQVWMPKRDDLLWQIEEGCCRDFPERR